MVSELLFISARNGKVLLRPALPPVYFDQRVKDDYLDRQFINVNYPWPVDSFTSSQFVASLQSTRKLRSDAFVVPLFMIFIVLVGF